MNHQHIPISSLLTTEFRGGDVASRRSLGPLSLGSLRSTIWNSVFAHPSAPPVSRGFCSGNRVRVFESRVWRLLVPPVCWRLVAELLRRKLLKIRRCVVGGGSFDIVRNRWGSMRKSGSCRRWGHIGGCYPFCKEKSGGERESKESGPGHAFANRN